MIATTISNSMRVKPFALRIFITTPSKRKTACRLSHLRYSNGNATARLFVSVAGSASDSVTSGSDEQ
jgi:hypothetical protein